MYARAKDTWSSPIQNLSSASSAKQQAGLEQPYQNTREIWCRRRESNDTPLLITRNLLKKHDRSKRNNRPMPHSDVQNHVQRNRSLRRCSSTQVHEDCDKLLRVRFKIPL